jgi:hypothetical protein
VIDLDRGFFWLADTSKIYMNSLRNKKVTAFFSKNAA